MSVWRTCLVVLSIFLLIVGSGCDRETDSGEKGDTAGQEPVYDGTIIAMGDSLTAGLGVDPEQSYPAMLEKRLHAEGINYRVVNAGISGETSSGARSRVGWIIDHHPDLVIVETGANDGLRGLSPDLLRGNLSVVVESLQNSGITVVLTGMKMMTNLGEEYLGQFNAVYPDVAARYGVIFMPFFLEGVAGRPELNQQDAIHPNEQGYRLIIENLLPYVRQAVNSRPR